MRYLRSLLLGMVVPAALLGLWQAASMAGWVNPVYLPPPSEVARAGQGMLLDGELLAATAATVGLALAGLAISVALAVPCGALFAASRLADGLTYPAREFLRALPTVAVVPALMVILGPGRILEVVAVVFGAVWPVLLGTMLGLRQTDRILLDVARVHRLPPVRTMTMVRLPAALPQIMTGVRVSLAIALVIALVVEMMSGHGGLGSLVVEARSRFRSAEVFAIVAVMAVAGLVLNALMVRLERRAWRGAEPA